MTPFRMKQIISCFFLCRLLPALVLLGSPLETHAAKVWQSLVSGSWADATNWSGSLAPDSTSAVLITNVNSKTVTIDASTPAANLTIASLLLSAPPGSTNLLWLNSAGTNNPLLMFNGFSLTNGGALSMTDSAVAVDPSVLFVHIDGSMTVDSGLVTFGDVAPADTNNTPTTTKIGDGPNLTGTLVINGGTLQAGELKVGADVPGAQGLMNMSGGAFYISSMMTVGHDLQTTGFVAVTGGLLTATNEELRVGNLGFGQLTVSNATLLLTNLAMGHDAGSIGFLNLQAGGLITLSSSLSIARLNGSTGSVAMAGGQLDVPGHLYVGHEGDGQMTLSNGTVSTRDLLVAAATNTGSGSLTILGGNLNISNSFVIGGPAPAPATASLEGGSFAVSSTPVGSAFTTVPNGTLLLLGGSLQTDNLLLTNNTGQFVFHSGTLSTAHTLVNNGAPFVVGDGLSPAVLYLNGGTHTFANGLVISTNATLEGCGTIVGALTNYGTIATNCNGLAQPLITAISSAGLARTVSFTTIAGHTYTLQFVTNLTSTNWSPIPPSSNSSGGLMILDDPSPTNRSRFYRIQGQ